MKVLVIHLQLVNNFGYMKASIVGCGLSGIVSAILLKKLGYKVTGEFLDNGYIVETEPGEEEKVGAEFVDNYPEFFGGYEREDVKNTHIYDECDSIISDIEEIRDSVGNLNKYGKSVLSDDWNQNIDEVIKRLEKLKH